MTKPVLLFLVAAVLPGQSPGPISINELRGDLSFLASDALAGRYTPSPGLDIAAEFIASRFRAEGLDPLAGDSYFQPADMVNRVLPKPDAPISIRVDAAGQEISAKDYSILNIAQPLHLAATQIVALDDPDAAALARKDLAGKVVAITQGDQDLLEPAERSPAALVVFVSRDVVWPAVPLLFEKANADAYRTTVLSVRSDSLGKRLETGASTADWTWTADLPGPDDRNVVLRNVGGVIRGSDPELKKQVIVVSAHYDHLGTDQTAGPLAMSGPTPSDRIYNGANDDGSGTVSVIAIADALHHAHPRRTVLCIVFFGEERGLIGSQYYAAHPAFPLAETVADFNLEQLGRIDNLVDDTIVRHPAWLTLTGFNYTDIAAYVKRAAALSNISVAEDRPRSEAYFERSDNYSLSQRGVPSTTITTALNYPDYHAVGDEWPKIDYSNMALVDRTLSVAVLMAADSPAPPHWNANNPDTSGYRRKQRAQ